MEQNEVMIARFWSRFRKSVFGFAGSREQPAGGEGREINSEPQPVEVIDLDLAPNDPLAAYLLSASGVVELDRLNLDSPALRQLKQNQVKLIVPLVSQGELIGMLNLGPRRSEQDYSTDDRRLLNTLATQAAPALRVAQLVQQQQAAARERERIEQELRVARVIQQTLLPKEVPQLEGWQIAALWQPARAVSGDFYDFYAFPDGRLGMVIADVTDKGVPAALVMATTRSILRSAAERWSSPGQILHQANNLLCPDIPPNMYVTCLYAILDPANGRLVYANAGHPPPYQSNSEQVTELLARGMPLGLIPEMEYEEKEATLAPGDSVFFYSDGLIEAHNPREDMFGFPLLRQVLAQNQCAEDLVQCLLGELDDFTGPDWEQEDDVTFVTLQRAARLPQDAETRLLAELSVPSAPGNERQAMEQVAAVVAELGMQPARLERLKTAVAEATMNAMEHGSHYQADQPVDIRVSATPHRLRIAITDHGGGQVLAPTGTPDLEAKLQGQQSPRGWGLFLIENMVDEMNVISDQSHHTLELFFDLKGEA
jgi:serine phosphatase RsbU (regulator of sigma subunit)/anti-sigma regulatory factor (Ser/Thr protein kinase)